MKKAPLLLFTFGFIFFGNLSAQKPRLIIQSGHSNTINDLEFSPDNKFLASAGKDKIIVLWDVGTGKQFQRLEGQPSSVTAIAFSPKRNLLASVGLDNSLLVWDYITGELFQRFVLDESSLLDVTFSTDGEKIYCCNTNVYQISLGDSTVNKLPLTAKNSFNTVKCSPLGNYLAVGGKNEKAVIVYDLKHESILRRFNAKVNDVFFSDDDKTLTGAGNLATLFKWKVEHPTFFSTFTINAERIWYKYFSVTMNDKFFAGGNRNGLIYVYNLKNGMKKFTLNGHFNPVRALAIDTSGSLLASAGDDDYIAIWNFKNGEIIKPFWGTGRNLQTINFNTDSDKVIAGYSDGSLTEFDFKLRSPSANYKFNLTDQKILHGNSYSIESIIPADSIRYEVLVLRHKRSNKDADAFKREKYFTSTWNSKTNTSTKLLNFKETSTLQQFSRDLSIESQNFSFYGNSDGKIILHNNNRKGKPAEISA